MGVVIFNTCNLVVMLRKVKVLGVYPWLGKTRSALSTMRCFSSKTYFEIDYEREQVPVMDSEKSLDNYQKWERKSLVSSFTDLYISQSYRKLMKKEGIVTPTPIQIQALPLTTKYCGPHIIIESVTGSGKTLAYLLPAVIDTRPGLHTVVVVPSQELAIQVYHQACMYITGNPHGRKVGVVYKGVNEEERLKEFFKTRPNILIGTPAAVAELIRGEHSKMFSSAYRLVLDEADKLLLKTSSSKEKILKKKKSKKKSAPVHIRPAREITECLLSVSYQNRLQVICTSATISPRLIKELEDMGIRKDKTKVLSSSTHRTLPSTICHQFIRCRDKASKVDMMVNHFNNAGITSALVFAHRGKSIIDIVRRVEEGFDIKAVALYEQVKDLDTYTSFLSDFRKGIIQMVIASEETMRGLDFKFLTTLYILEVPQNPTEYLHLAGRVGRVGKVGAAIVMVDDEDFHGNTRIERIYRALDINGSEIQPLVDITKHLRSKK